MNNGAVFNAYKFQHVEYRPGGRCKILGVLMTLCGPFGTNLEILGVLNASFPPIFRNIGGAIALPAPPVPPALQVNWIFY